MKLLSIVSMSFSLILAASAFASETEVDFNSLVPANEYETSATYSDFDFDHHHEHYRCFAENGHGQRFEGEGMYPREAQEHAMMRCRERSHHCRPLGCHRT